MFKSIVDSTFKLVGGLAKGIGNVVEGIGKGLGHLAGLDLRRVLGDYCRT